MTMVRPNMFRRKHQHTRAYTGIIENQMETTIYVYEIRLYRDNGTENGS